MKLIAFLSFLILLKAASSYTFTDDVGKIDWYKENFGHINKVYFQDDSNQKILYISTSSSVLAAINQKNGEIIWRRVLEQLGEFYLIKNPNFTYLLSVTCLGNITNINAWDTLGNLIWQQPYSVNTCREVVAVNLNEDIDGDGIPDLFLLSSNRIQVRSARDGKLVWKKDNKALETFVSAWKSKDATIDVAITSSEGVEVQELASSKGELISTYPVSNQPIESFAETSTHFIALSRDNLFIFKKEGRMKNSHDVSAIGIQSGKLLSNSLKNHFILQDSDNINVVRIGDSLSVKHKFKNTCTVAATADGDHIVSFCDSQSFLHNLQGSKVELSLKSPCVSAVFADISVSSNILVVKCDWETQYLEITTRITWSREEALSSINQVQFVHLPSKHSISTLQHTKEKLEHETGLFSQLSTVFSSQLDVIKEWFSFGQEEKIVGNLTPKDYKDPFGFRQLIVIVTVPGTIFGIDSQTSQTVWKQFLPNVCDTDSSQQLLFTRTVAHYPPNAYLVQQCGNKVRVHSLEPLTGKFEKDIELLHTGLKQALILPIQDISGNFLSVLHSGDVIHLLPNTNEAKEAFRQKLHSIYLHYFDPLARVLTGYAIKNSTSNMFELDVIWTFPLSTGGLQPIEIQLATSQHSVYSPLKILPDSSALEKYLNPHLIAIIASYPFNGQTSEHVKIFLIDTVTGNIIHIVSIPSASGNIGVVQSENNIFYYYWSTKHVRVEIGVIELYHKSITWSRTEFSSFVQSQCCDVLVLQQNFIFGNAIKKLAVTNTLQEISPKMILVGMFSGQIVGVPKNLLDAMRPSKPAPGAQPLPPEYGIVPYDPIIPINPKAVINYFNKVEKLKNIVASPSYLESTSLVIAYGLDVFFTRTTPANSFDILNSDFNYQALVLTIISLLFFTIVSSRIVKKQDLMNKWK